MDRVPRGSAALPGWRRQQLDLRTSKASMEYTGGYTVICRIWCARNERRHREMFSAVGAYPPDMDPDFGRNGGDRHRSSRRTLTGADSRGDGEPVMVFQREEGRSVLPGARRAFAWFGEACAVDLYDDTSIAKWRGSLDDGEQLRTQVFEQFSSHYLFPRSLCPGGRKGNDKGNVRER
jgi:hypothetical protein